MSSVDTAETIIGSRAVAAAETLRITPFYGVIWLWIVGCTAFSVPARVAYTFRGSFVVFRCMIYTVCALSVGRTSAIEA